MYVSGDVLMSGNLNSESLGLVYYNLNLKTGWNKCLFKANPKNKRLELLTTTNPSNLKWYFEF
jgi:hypothetical protein